MRGVKSLKRAMLLAALFGAGIIVGACAYALLKSRHECPRVETAFRLNDPRDAAIFAGQIRTVEWTDVNGTTTRFGVGDGAAPNCTLTIKNNEPLSIPDHHGATTLTLVEIGGSKAKIAFMQTFDHRSFRRDLMSVDCGIVELEIRKEDP